MLAAAAVSLSACATSTDYGTRAVGDRPMELNTTEASMWYQMDEAEADLQTSGRLVEDARLNAYVDDLVCRIAGEFCSDIRVYVVDNPGFNAMMAPNGMMVINTGLLLRADSEDELGFVIGHELVHYIENHALEQRAATRNANITAAVLSSVVSIGIAAGTGTMMGQGYSGSGGSIAAALAYGGAFSYSREREAEADAMGLEMAIEQGLDPKAGARIWSNLLAELEASDDNRRADRAERSGLFRTHPIIRDRIDALESQAADYPDVEPRVEAYDAVIAPFIGDWLDAQIGMRDNGSSLYLIDRGLEAGRHPGIFQAARARVLVQRGEEGDAEAAMDAYRAAIAYEDAPADAFRDYGDLLRRQGENAEAAQAFTTYLQRAPQARDARLVERYIENLMGETE